MLNEEIVMTPAMLATITRYDVGTVEKALQIFMQLGLVEQLPDNSYYMLELEGMVGKTSTEADRKHRDGSGEFCPVPACISPWQH